MDITLEKSTSMTDPSDLPSLHAVFHSSLLRYLNINFKSEKMSEARERETQRPQKHVSPARDRFHPTQASLGDAWDAFRAAYGRVWAVYGSVWKKFELSGSVLLNRSSGPYIIIYNSM